MHKLVIQDDEGKTTVVPLIKEQITVGRKEGNTIRLTERNVSRQHARISRRNGSIEIEDLDSYNGVRVNGSRIQGRMGLKLSDRIQIGDYLIELKAEGAAPDLDAYGDQKTVPIDRPGPAIAAAAAAISGTAIPIVQNATDPDAQTTKMPMSFPGMTMGNQAVEPHGDTDPAAAVLPQTEPIPEVYGRLVILSSNYAGREYELNKPGLVIGRTEDNDVVVNHRSISRHHAKVVRENGRYAIVDLQSSNGVRVNGEEYGKVELRRGDIIDLGHVRLRFIEPGEDFIFGRDAQPVPLPSERRRGLIYALLGIVALAIIAVFAFGGGDEQTGEKATTGPGDTNDVVNQTPPGPKAVTPDQATDDIPPLLDKAKTAMSERRWDEAIKAVDQVLELDNKNETATQWRARAEEEKANKAILDKLNDAAKKRNHRAVIDALAKIPKDSVYKDEAWEAHNKAKDAYVAQVGTATCPQLSKMKTEASKLWPEARQAVQTAFSSKCTQVATTGPKTTRPKDDEPKVKPPDPPTPKPGDAKKRYDRHMKDAQKASMDGQYGVMLKSCKKALDAKPNDQKAIKLCAIAGCRLNNARVAKRYIDKLRGGLKQQLKNMCIRSGLSQASNW